MSGKLSEPKLSEIRRRNQSYQASPHVSGTAIDRENLLAHIDALTAENERLKEELELWRPMTDEEAERALNEAREEPISDDEIKAIVAKVTDPTYRPTEPQHAQMAAKIERLEAEVAVLTRGHDKQESLECKIRKAYRGLNDPLFESSMDELRAVDAELTSARAENERLTWELGECQQRLAALAVDPANVDELADRVRTIYWDRPAGSWDNLTEHCKAKWRRIVREVSSVVRSSNGQFECLAKLAGSAGGNDPQDCDWPFCGCDPKADKVLEAIEESGRFTEVAELQRQLAEATKRLAELTKPADAEELAKVYWDDVAHTVLEKWDNAGEYQKRLVISGTQKVAARVRAPLVQQIADRDRRIDALNAQIETAEAALDKLAAAKGDKLTVAGESIAMGDVLVGWALGQIAEMRAEMNRLAAALGKGEHEIVSILLAALGSDAQGVRQFGGGKFGNKPIVVIGETAKSLAEQAVNKLAELREDLSATTTERDIGTGICDAFNQGWADFKDGMTEKDAERYQSITEKNYWLIGWRAYRDKADRDRLAAELATTKQELAELWKVCFGEPPISEEKEVAAMVEAIANSVRRMKQSATAKPAASEPADHSRDANEKVEPTERRFVCPRCGNSCYTELPGGALRCVVILQGGDCCNWSGTWAEVEAAWANINASAVWEIVEVVPAEQLAAANQAREAAEQRADEYVKEIERRIKLEAELRREVANNYEVFRDANYWRWQGDGSDYPESLTCQVVMTAEQLRELLQRAEAAEAAAGVIREKLDLLAKATDDTLKTHPETKCCTLTKKYLDDAKAILATHPGLAATELRVLRVFAEKVRKIEAHYYDGKFVKLDSDISQAVYELDKALSQGEQRGEVR